MNEPWPGVGASAHAEAGCLPAGSQDVRGDQIHSDAMVLGGETLHFSDQRHFGFMNIVRSSELNAAKELCKLAPEPFGEDFSVDYLRSKMKASSRPIKEFSLDQTKVCGLGNIYAAEALFESGIDPRKRADRLTKPKAELLHSAIIAVLEPNSPGRASQHRRKFLWRTGFARLACLRPRGRGMPCLRRKYSTHKAGRPLDLLLPEVSTLKP